MMVDQLCPLFVVCSTGPNCMVLTGAPCNTSPARSGSRARPWALTHRENFPGQRIWNRRLPILLGRRNSVLHRRHSARAASLGTVLTSVWESGDWHTMRWSGVPSCERRRSFGARFRPLPKGRCQLSGRVRDPYTEIQTARCNRATRASAYGSPSKSTEGLGHAPLSSRRV